MTCLRWICAALLGLLTALPAQGAEEAGTWIFDRDEYSSDIRDEELEAIASEEDCYRLLARKPLAAKILYPKRYAKYCMAPMVAHLLSWFPAGKPIYNKSADVYRPFGLGFGAGASWGRVIGRISPGYIVKNLSETIAMYSNLRWRGVFHRFGPTVTPFLFTMKSTAYDDRLEFLFKVIDYQEKEGLYWLAEAVRRGYDMRVRQGLYHPEPTTAYIVYPSRNLFDFHKWVTPIRIEYAINYPPCFRRDFHAPLPLDRDALTKKLMSTVDDALALQIYLNSVVGIYAGPFSRVLQDVAKYDSTRHIITITGILMEERARQGICDELLHFYDGAPLAQNYRYMPDFSAFLACMNQPADTWQGTEDSTIAILKKITHRFIRVLEDNTDYKKNKTLREELYAALKLVNKSSDPGELQQIFLDFWERVGKAIIPTVKRDNEALRKQAPKLLKQYGPYPKPGWSAQIAEIHSKTPEEWSMYFGYNVDGRGLAISGKSSKRNRRGAFGCGGFRGANTRSGLLTATDTRKKRKRLRTKRQWRSRRETPYFPGKLTIRPYMYNSQSDAMPRRLGTLSLLSLLLLALAIRRQ